MELLDLRIFKGLLGSQSNGVEFALHHDQSLFLPGEARRFGKLLVDYIRAYRAIPTRRTLLERNAGSTDSEILIKKVWKLIDEFEYDLAEYTFDLEKLKARYQLYVLEDLKSGLEDIDKENASRSVKNAILKLQRAVSVESGRSHIQEVAGDYIPEFQDRYEAVLKNIEEDSANVLTHYSLIDAVTGGIAPAELVIVGGETSAGKALGVDTPMLTPSGWTTMGKLKVGDVVFGDDGIPCNVVAVSGVMSGHKCFKLYFSDGETITADAGHLWKTCKRTETEWKPITTEGLFQLGEDRLLDEGHIVSTEEPLALPDRRIIAVVEVSSVPVQCIQVDSTTSCYLCGYGLIPTHNSQMLLNMALQMWRQTNEINTPPDQFARGHNVLFFSLEMPYDDCFGRFLARLAGIPERSIAQSGLDEAQSMRMRRALKFIEEYQKAGYYFGIVDVPRNVTIEEIELRYNDALLKYRPEIVVIDYMGLMHDPRMVKEQDWLKMGAIAGTLHEFSRAYNVIVLTAVQLTDIKRGSGKQDQSEQQRVGVHRIGRSSHIMHHANLGIQIETRLNEISYPDLRYHIIKNRKGPLGQGNMIKNFANASLIDVPCSDDDTPRDITDDIPKLIDKMKKKKDGEGGNGNGKS
jgi:replicative DNA helicase